MTEKGPENTGKHEKKADLAAEIADRQPSRPNGRQTSMNGQQFCPNKRQAEKLHVFYELLKEKNEVMNLTTLTEWKEVEIKHFADSLSIVGAYKFKGNERVIDIGSGAGFPGIPLKIELPGLSVCLLDARNKRVDFLREVIEKLGLKETDAVHARAEEIARRGEYREQYDLCVSRAVARLSVMAEYALPFVKPGGCFVAYKGADCRKEVDDAKKAIRLLGGVIEKEYTYRLPGEERDRSLIMIKKEKYTPERYPRRAGLPTKRPL